jgi:hypothetical protein
MILLQPEAIGMHSVGFAHVMQRAAADAKDM